MQMMVGIYLTKLKMVQMHLLLLRILWAYENGLPYNKADILKGSIGNGF